MKTFNVFQILRDHLQESEDMNKVLYKNIKFPPIKPNQDEDLKCCCCETFSSEYFLDQDQDPYCKSCYLLEYCDFSNCDSCGDLIHFDRCIKTRGCYECVNCLAKDEDEMGPLVCDHCYDKLAEKVKSEMNKLGYLDHDWDKLVYREALFSCDNCGLLCKCQRSDYSNCKGFDFMCYDCTHPGEKELQEKYDKLEKENEQLQKENEKLKLHIKYKPDGEGALEALRSFGEGVKGQN